MDEVGGGVGGGSQFVGGVISGVDRPAGEGVEQAAARYGGALSGRAFLALGLLLERLVTLLRHVLGQAAFLVFLAAAARADGPRVQWPIEPRLPDDSPARRSPERLQIQRRVRRC